MSPKPEHAASKTGRLRIGDDWNAITIIALSQTNPLKAVAEFVENSIDAGARTITITRGREHGAHYLTIADDGQGIVRDPEGLPDFRYVATHICDSMKRRLKANGAAGIQGEFGIGLLSFWTVGEELTLTSAAVDGRTYTMRMKRNDPSYTVTARRLLFPACGTELTVAPLLPGIRQFSGEKIQWYLASELRERIRQSGVAIKIADRHARKEFKVEPRQFTGRLLHGLPVPATAFGQAYVEIYLSDPDPAKKVGLYRSGTRLIEDLAEIDALARTPWTEKTLQGIVDVPFVHVTPATRMGVIYDDVFAAFIESLGPLEEALAKLMEEQRRAEEEQTSQQILRTIQKAFKEALLALPAEEYDWFEIPERARPGLGQAASGDTGISLPDGAAEAGQAGTSEERQRHFFEFAGPLFQVRVSPASCVVAVGQSRTFSAIARDRTGHRVEEGLTWSWGIVEGEGSLQDATAEFATFTAPAEPGLVRIRLSITQGPVSCQAEALVTVTDSLIPETKDISASRSGLPGYTFQRAPGQLWRSRFDEDQNVIVINNGHRDFVYASKNKALKLRFISRLFAKELVYKNFPGIPPAELLERLIELSLYTEENLK